MTLPYIKKSFCHQRQAAYILVNKWFSGHQMLILVLVRQFLLYSQCLVFNKEFLCIHPPWIFFPFMMFILFYMLIPENTLFCIFLLLNTVWPLSLQSFFSISKYWYKWETKDLLICLCDILQPWANWKIHPRIGPPFAAYPISNFYRNNKIWHSFGFNCFLVYSHIAFIGKHSRRHPFALSLFLCRKIKSYVGWCLVFYNYPPKFVLPSAQLKSNHKRH